MAIYLFALFCLALAAMAATASGDASEPGALLDAPGIDKDTLARLTADATLLLVQEDAQGKLQMTTSGILVDRPPDVVFRTITDYVNYPKFMPSMEECEIVATHGDVKDVRFAVKFKFAIFSVTVDYVLRTTFKSNREITWKLLSSKGNKLRQSIGSWRLVPAGGGKQTAAFYSLYSDATAAVPGMSAVLKKEPTMETAINVSTCIMVLRAVKNRSENPAWTRAR
jgi:ribosome-associated toxin RatA of RatAB toxin-antitoxin module